MLEKPDLQDERIVASMKDEYGLRVKQVSLLPLGADQNTAVYSIVTEGGGRYFLKLRCGEFDETSVALPKYLGDHGIKQIIAPLTTKAGQLWGNLDSFKTMLYPFVEGHNGFGVEMTDRVWVELGAALKRIHTTVIPPTLLGRIPQETYAAQWREIVKTFLVRVEMDTFDDPHAAKLAALLRMRRAEVLDLVERAERLAEVLVTRSPQLACCHSDLHGANVLISANDAFYIVDWDNPILAPKERDLMFVGGAQFGNRRTAKEEETLFYRGYGRTQIDVSALAYYRYERIIEDIGAYGQQLLLTKEGGPDREKAIRSVEANFLPGNTIEMAYNSEKT